MFRIMLGIIIGIILVLLFIYSGGGDLIKELGVGVEKAGTKASQFEKNIKEGKEGVLKAIEGWKGKKGGEKTQ